MSVTADIHAAIVTRLQSLVPGTVREVKPMWFDSAQQFYDVYATGDGFHNSPICAVSFFNSEEYQGSGQVNNQFCRLDSSANFLVAVARNDMANGEDRFAVVAAWREALLNLISGYEFAGIDISPAEIGWISIQRAAHYSPPGEPLLASVFQCRVSFHEVVGSNGA